MTEFKKAFIDTPIFIYLLERNPGYYEKAKETFCSCINNNVPMITSVITYEEYCLYPYSNKRPELIDNFENFLMDMNIETLGIDIEAAGKSSMLRAKYKEVKGIPSLQLATAIKAGCDVFFTNDEKLRQIEEIMCITLDEI